MHRTTIERRLSDAHQRLVRARSELAVIDEQLIVVNEMADDTRLRALVAETPVAAKEHDEASRQASAMQRSRQALVERIADLERRQDDLLERLVVGNRLRSIVGQYGGRQGPRDRSTGVSPDVRPSPAGYRAARPCSRPDAGRQHRSPWQGAQTR